MRYRLDEGQTCPLVTEAALQRGTLQVSEQLEHSGHEAQEGSQPRTTGRMTGNVAWTPSASTADD
jgi:hypothetical protein